MRDVIIFRVLFAFAEEVCAMVDQVLAITVVLLPTAFAVVLELVNDEIKKSVYWRVGVMAFGLSLSALTAYQMVRATRTANRDREQAIRETSNQVSASVSASVSESVSKSVTKAVSDQYTGTINNLQGQIGILQTQLSAQGKSVETIKGSDIVTGRKPVRVEIANPGNLPSGEARLDVHVSAIEGTPRPEFGKLARQLILTTNKLMNGARAIVKCQNKFNRGMAQVAGSGVQIGNGWMVDEKTYQSGISLPNWAPDFPLIITLYSDGDPGDCTIRPL
jgi:hypothetical protein